MKLVCVLFILVSMNFDFVMPVNPQCSYEYFDWNVVGRTYHCDVKNYLNIISSETAVISGATGSHSGGKNNDNVLGFYAGDKKIEIFPRGLEKIYKNLKLIFIQFGRIKEIHQSDLKPFSQLGYLNLYENDIEVLEEGLFDFNPKLGYISFEYNKISQIHLNVFDHLTKLTYLYLRENQCIDNSVNDNSAEKVKELIKEVKLKCPSPYKVAYKEVQKLKLNFNDQNLKFTEKLTKVENHCLNLSPKISLLEATSKDLLTRVDNIVANLSTSSLSNKNELITLQSQISKLKEDSNKIKDMITKQSQDALKMNSTIEETKKFIDTLNTHQNQNIQKTGILEASLNNFNVSASDVLSKINEIKATVSQQSEDIKAVNKKVQDTEKLIITSETRSLQKIHQNMKKVNGEINYLTTESKNNSDKIDKLEAESKTSTREALNQSDKIQEINLKIASSENQIKASDTLHHQNIQELKTTTEEILKKIEDTEKRLILRQSEDIKAINLKIKYNEELLKAFEARQSKNIEEIEQNYKQEIEKQEKTFNEKMEKLETASKELTEKTLTKIKELEVLVSMQFKEIQAKNLIIQESEKLINASMENLNRKIEGENKKFSDKFDKLEAATKSSNEEIKRKIEELNMKNFNDIQAINGKVQETEKLINASKARSLEKTNQNIEMVTQQIKNLTKNNSEMEARLAQKQTNDTQDIKSDIDTIKNFIAESYMFHFEKIENLNTSVIEIQKKIKASEVKTLKIMEQKMQTLRQEMKAELATSTKASTDKILHKIEQMESRLNSKQPNDVEVINSKIQVIKPSELNNLKRLEADNKNLKILGDSAHERITKLNGYLTSTNNKVNQLEKALNSTDVSLQTLKTEMMTEFGKIVEKLGENAAKIEQETTKIKVMSTNLKDSYNHAFFRLHENMKHIESGLANLNFELILNGIIQVSNDTKLNND